MMYYMIIEGVYIIFITIPWLTSHVIHACDIIEDVAIAYGYNNIEMTIPDTNCISKQVNMTTIPKILYDVFTVVPELYLYVLHGLY